MRRSLILLLILSVWIINVASTPVVTGAKVRLKAKKYQETVDLLEENKGQYPDDPELFYYLGRAYAGIANWEKAGENFSASLVKNPDKGLKREIEKYRDYYWQQFIKDAGPMMEKKLFLPAIEKFRIANKINPQRQEGYYNLGVALLEQGQIYEAADPPKPDSAKICFDEAIESIKTALDLDPENENFFKNYGQAYLIAGRDEEAIEVFEEYLEKYPDDITTQKKLINIFMSRKEYEKAAEGFDIMIEEAFDEMSTADLFNAGTAYNQLYYTLSKGEDEESKAKSKEMVEKAAECYAAVIEEDPTDCEAGEQLYYLYIYQEEWKKVVETIESMYDNGCERTFNNLSNLGVAYIKIGDKQKAVEIYKEAQEKKPKEGTN